MNDRAADGGQIPRDRRCPAAFDNSSIKNSSIKRIPETIRIPRQDQTALNDILRVINRGRNNAVGAIFDFKKILTFNGINRPREFIIADKRPRLLNRRSGRQNERFALGHVRQFNLAGHGFFFGQRLRHRDHFAHRAVERMNDRAAGIGGQRGGRPKRPGNILISKSANKLFRPAVNFAHRNFSGLDSTLHRRGGDNDIFIVDLFPTSRLSLMIFMREEKGQLIIVKRLDKIQQTPDMTSLLIGRYPHQALCPTVNVPCHILQVWQFCFLQPVKHFLVISKIIFSSAFQGMSYPLHSSKLISLPDAYVLFIERVEAFCFPFLYLGHAVRQHILFNLFLRKIGIGINHRFAVRRSQTNMKQFSCLLYQTLDGKYDASLPAVFVRISHIAILPDLIRKAVCNDPIHILMSQEYILADGR